MSEHTMPVTIQFTPEEGKSKSVCLCNGESVLDGLLRVGVKVPNACRGGVCQSCVLQATGGTPPPASQAGLKESWRNRGLFLSCVCKPTSDLTVRPASDAGVRIPAVVRQVEQIGGGVARVRIRCDLPLEYRAGQFVNLVRPDGLTRSYSLASLHPVEGLCRGDEHLELHVRRIPGGQMSNWLHDGVKAGDTLAVTSPLGDCYYSPGKPDQPILLIGTGTGLAPLYAIARDALRHGHTGPIRLYHGALERNGLYLIDELNALQSLHSNFSYTACVLRESAEPSTDQSQPISLRVGAIDLIVFREQPKLAGHRVYLCGDPTLVNTLRKKVFLAGAAMKEISADAFLTGKA